MNEFIIDVILLLFLSCSIVWCAIVHRRLKKIGFERAEVESFVRSVDEVVERAQTAMVRLRSTAEEIAARIASDEDQAAARLDELNRLISAATRVSQRLETTLNGAYRHLAGDPSRVAGSDGVERRQPDEVPEHQVPPVPQASLRRPSSPRMSADQKATSQPFPAVLEPAMDDGGNGEASAGNVAAPRHRSTVNAILERLSRSAPRERSFTQAEAF